ncbi:hypothetical protein STEG23_020946 [Scotinomys teguina]
MEGNDALLEITPPGFSLLSSDCKRQKWTIILLWNELCGQAWYFQWRKIQDTPPCLKAVRGREERRGGSVIGDTLTSLGKAMDGKPQQYFELRSFLDLVT